jgi:ABC-type transporter Mla subunit MlaD
MDKGTQEKVTSPLFSDEECRRIVRSFIEAYIRGAVEVELPAPGDEDLLGEMIDGKALVDIKNKFTSLLSTAAGAVKSTEAEMQQAISQIFSLISSLRLSSRLKGEFLPLSNVDSRLGSLEERTANIERLLEELQNLIRIRGQSQ